MKLSDFSSCPLTTTCSTGRMQSTCPPRRTYRFLAIAPLMLTVALVAAACGGGGSKSSSVAASTSPTTTTPTGPGGISQAQIQAFTACLEQHGVSVPTTVVPPTTEVPPTTVAGQAPRRRFAGGGGAGAVFALLNNPADSAAVQACQSDLPAGTLQRLQQGQTALNAYISCMKDHGQTVSGRGFGGGRGPGGAGGAPTSSVAPPTTTAAFAAAAAICRPLLPQGRGFGGPGGSTTTTPAS
jgi:hypothetical protein